MARERLRADLEPGFASGFLRVITKVYALGEKNSRYLCECTAPGCGVRKEVTRCQLVSGDTRSCGCQKGQFWKNAKGQMPTSRNHGTPVGQARIRGPLRRCPVCRKSLALRNAGELQADGEVKILGRYCRYCLRITQEVA